ncbi:MAG: alpha/beta fold hydrolase [Candidatus Dadabacteria bacterium]
MILVLIIVALLFIFFIATYSTYWHDIANATEFQHRFKPKILTIENGTIEYALLGKGDPVLFVHGASGGYDQALTLGRTLLNDQFQIIAPSRYGYQNTKTESEFSVQLQADMHITLLDALGIKKVSVVGISSGAPSCIDLAIRYPERVSDLILIAPLTYSPQRLRNNLKKSWPFILSIYFKWDYPLWLGMNLIPSTILTRVGIPKKLQNALTTLQKKKIMKSLLPFKSKIKGLNIDGNLLSNPQPAQLHLIKTPTLVITSKDDPWKTIEGAKYVASKIANAKFICYQSGGHLLNGREEDVRFQLVTFILSETKLLSKDKQLSGIPA